MGLLKRAAAVVVATSVFTAVAFAEIKVMTEEFPPFNFTNEGKITGLSTEVVQSLMKKVGDVSTDIEVLPWSRAYTLIQNTQNLALYSMSRTPQRESMFKWVGPIATYKLSFWAKKGSSIKISSLEDAKKLKSIGVGLKDAGHTMLEADGFANLDPDPKNNNPKKLLAGNIDAWLVGDVVGVYRAIQAGANPEEMERIYDVKENSLFIAFNKDTPDDVVVKWQKAFDELKVSGELDKIKAKYLK